MEFGTGFILGFWFVVILVGAGLWFGRTHVKAFFQKHFPAE